MNKKIEKNVVKGVEHGKISWDAPFLCFFLRICGIIFLRIPRDYVRIKRSV